VTTLQVLNDPGAIGVAPGPADTPGGADMGKGTCSEQGCEKPAHARARCHTHYLEWWMSQPDRERCADCTRPSKSRGLCDTHYKYRVRHDLPFPAPAYDKAPAIERFISKVEIVGRCWVWTGALDADGYGKFFDRTLDRKSVAVHRWAYEHFREPIPDGLQIDHLCRVRSCVNPHHLAVVTIAQNLRRGDLPRVNNWGPARSRVNP
jgi:hypothetical protein